MQQGRMMPPRYMCPDLIKHIMKKLSRFQVRAHALAVGSSLWRGGHCDKCSCAAVQNEVHGACSFPLSRLVCGLSQREVFVPLSHFRQAFAMEAPYILHTLPSRTVSDFLSNRQNKLCIPSQTLWNSFWLMRTSHKPISQTARLPVHPNL